jgi:thiosulfate/3-mercaptopyruvate sulfurtransferase
MLTVPNVIVSCQWLQQHLHAANLVVLNATIPKVTAKKETSEKQLHGIPSARFFDIKGRFSDAQADFPNTMISAEDFEQKAQQLGIHQDSCVVIYDDHGIYSSPRAWCMFKAMGFENVAVLDGGLPQWKSLGFETIPTATKEVTRGNFTSHPKKQLFVDFQHVLDATKHSQNEILDARSAARFHGTAPEPRQGVRSGHIPSAKSLPYASLLEGHTLQNKEVLQRLFQERNPENKPMIFSCGTGITACVLALGAEIAGYQNTVVYDGSWTEWGSLEQLPVEI